MYKKYYILLLSLSFLYPPNQLAAASLGWKEVNHQTNSFYLSYLQGPLATFWSDPEECSLKVFFTSEDTTPGILHYWDFGNGQYSTGVSPFHIYLVAGKYKVRHTVVNVSGVDTEEMWIDVGKGVPFGKALFETLVRQDDGVTTAWFYAYNKKGEHYWDFGDGNSGVGFAPHHTYTQPGIYTVTHTVQTDLCTFSRMQAVKVFEESISIGEAGVETKISEAIANGLLSPAESVGLHLHVKGTLLLDSIVGQYKFRNCNIRMEAGAKILVESGTRLSIGQVSTVYGTDKMWFGIEVMTGGSLHISERVIIEDAQYAMYMHHGSHLSSIGNFFNRNYISLYVPPAANGDLQKLNLETPLWGNRMFCSHPLAEAFDGQTYETGLPTQGERSFAGIVFNNLEIAGIGISYPYTYSYFNNLSNGILLRGCEVVQITNCLFEDIISENAYGAAGGFGIKAEGNGSGMLYQRGAGINHSLHPFEDSYSNVVSFSNCTNGIDVRNMGADIGENMMYGIRETAVQLTDVFFSPVYLIDNQIQSLKRGCIFRNCYANPMFEIRDNFVEVGESGFGENGIFLEEVYGGVGSISLVKNNTIRIFYCPYPDGTLNGIQLKSCDRISVIDNFVRLEEPKGPTTQEITGIKIVDGSQLDISCNEVEAFQLIGYLNRGIWMKGGANIQMRCNTTDKTGYGFQFHDMNQQIDFSGNYMVRHFYGLHIGPYSQMTSAATSGEHVHRGNEWWSNPYNAYEPNLMGALHEGNAQNVSLSKFSVYPDYKILSNQTVMDPEPWATPNVSSWNSVEWFSVPSSPPAVVDGCNQACTPGIPIAISPEISLLDLYIAGDEPLWSACYEGLRWDARQYLYGKLEKNRALIRPNSVLDTFFTTYTYSNLPTFCKVEQAVNELFQLEPEDEAYFREHYAQQKKYVQAMEKYLGKWAENAVEECLQDAGKQMILAQIRYQIDQIKQKRAYIFKERIEAAHIIRSQLAVISPATTPENFRKEIYDTQLGMVIEGNCSVDSERITRLQEIGEVHPAVGGRSVYQARALLNGKTGYHWDRFMKDEQLPDCGETSKKADLEKAGMPETFSIYPNPSSGEEITIYISAHRKNKMPILCTLFDKNGRAIKAKVVPAGESIFQFNHGGLSAGTYFIQLSQPGKVLRTEQFLVIRD